MKKIFIAALCLGLFVTAGSVWAQQDTKVQTKAKVENAEKATAAKGTTKACCAAKADGTKAACCAKKDGTKAACCADKKSSCTKAAAKSAEKKTN
jgi:hypothetical protein